MTEVGELFAGRYRIESQLGQGGMGSVYPALDFVHRRGRLHRDVKLGNIWEWTQDKYSGSSEARVLRGGFWYSVPRHARASDRLRYEPTNRYDNVGFRCAQ